MILLCCFCFSRIFNCVRDSCFLFLVPFGVLYPEVKAGLLTPDDVSGVAFCRDPGSSSSSNSGCHCCCCCCFPLPFILVASFLPLLEPLAVSCSFLDEIDVLAAGEVCALLAVRLEASCASCTARSPGIIVALLLRKAWICRSRKGKLLQATRAKSMRD